MKLKILLALVVLPIALSAQDYIESFTHNTDFRGAQRHMQYVPTADGYIASTNGKNLYTRALYGSNTLWRLETSDTPIFAAYHKTENRNIHFTINVKGREMRLDSVAHCSALYKGGRRVYLLLDPSWGDGTITLTAVAASDREAALWRVEAFDMPKNTTITANCCSTVKVKLNRSGDMGADPANCFAPAPSRENLRQCSVKIGGKESSAYIEYAERDFTAAPQRQLKENFEKALADADALTSRVAIHTPDRYFNTLATSLLAAADGIWDGLTYQHGAVGWRMPLSGWRGAYTGDFLGWHDRARTHFDAYAASQVTEVEPTIAHPAQDPSMNMARAEKRWGTQMYSNGYICRNPNKNNTMHHYDMNLCYIDELLWHLQWCGDIDYARKIWPVIKLSLQWEKRNYDPDDDGLYDAYCCIWASDALYYNSGAVTHSSAYNYRANILAARIAELIGEDPEPYRREAQKTLSAMNSRLWLEDKGVWAEFCDFMGEQQLHTHPGLWTVYHAIDSRTGTPEQAYRATRYIDANIPHIPVNARTAKSVLPQGYSVVSTTDWLPYAWSINNVAFAEIYHTALAYWQAGRSDAASTLLKSAMLDGMYIGNSPGNIGQVSHYDAARGESYRDFADPVGMLSRALVEGLYGFTPELLYRKVSLRPGFPEAWGEASISHPDFDMQYSKTAQLESTQYASYALLERISLTLKEAMAPLTDTVSVTLPRRYAYATVAVDGKICDIAKVYDAGTPYATLRLDVPVHARLSQPVKIDVLWSGDKTEIPDTPAVRYADIPVPLGVESISGEAAAVDMAETFNADITDIFCNSYLSPRSPYTTLQLPVHGMGEWCHPKDTANIDDSALRRSGGALAVGETSRFHTPAEGHNIAYVSLFDNYPDSISIPLEGSAKALELLMAGSTNHMQCYNTNATLTVSYTDGTSTQMRLVPPYNWAPIEQAYYTDGMAFCIPTPPMMRVCLSDGTSSRDLGSTMGIEGVYGRRIPGGAANVLYMPLDSEKQLQRLSLKANANEVVIGIAAANYIK